MSPSGGGCRATPRKWPFAFEAQTDQRNGVLFYRKELFHSQIILDQNWALEAIYSIFRWDKCFKQLKKLHGRFSREDLELLIWSDYTPAEQNAFLGMMESCGICFTVRKLPNDEWEYIAPELLPKWSGAQEQLLGRLRDDPPDAEATARYVFLHEGILRGYLSRLGRHAKDAAIYWKYGCWFFEQTTRSQALIESQWDDAASNRPRYEWAWSWPAQIASIKRRTLRLVCIICRNVCTAVASAVDGAGILPSPKGVAQTIIFDTFPFKSESQRFLRFKLCQKSSQLL
jgi:hypothetical protein